MPEKKRLLKEIKTSWLNVVTSTTLKITVSSVHFVVAHGSGVNTFVSQLGANNLLQRYIDSMSHRLCELYSFKLYSPENKENLSPEISRSTLSANSWNGSSCALEENRDLVACKMDVFGPFS